VGAVAGRRAARMLGECETVRPPAEPNGRWGSREDWRDVMPRPMITVSEGLCNAASASECACQPDPAVDDAAVQAYYKAHQAELKCEHASGLCVRVAILPPSVMAL